MNRLWNLQPGRKAGLLCLLMAGLPGPGKAQEFGPIAPMPGRQPEYRENLTPAPPTWDTFSAPGPTRDGSPFYEPESASPFLSPSPVQPWNPSREHQLPRVQPGSPAPLPAEPNRSEYYRPDDVRPERIEPERLRPQPFPSEPTPLPPSFRSQERPGRGRCACTPLGSLIGDYWNSPQPAQPIYPSHPAGPHPLTRTLQEFEQQLRRFEPQSPDFQPHGVDQLWSEFNQPAVALHPVHWKNPVCPAQSLVAVSMSGDGLSFLTCCDRGVCQVWDTETGLPRSRFGFRLPDKVRHLLLSFTGRYVVFAGDFSWIYVWDVQTERELARFQAPGPAIRQVRLSDDERWLLATTVDGLLLRTELHTGRSHAIQLPPQLPMDNFDVSADGQCVVVGSFSTPILTLLNYGYGPEQPRCSTLEVGVASARHLWLRGNRLLVGDGRQLQAVEADFHAGRYHSIQGRHLRIPHAGQELHLSQSGRYLLHGVQGEQLWEMSDLALYSSQMIHWPPGTEAVLAVTPDLSRALLRIRGRQHVTLWTLPRPMLASEQKLRLTLHWLLRHQRYAELRQLFSAAAESREPFVWDRERQPRLDRLAQLLTEPVGVTHEIRPLPESLETWANGADDPLYPRLLLARNAVREALEVFATPTPERKALWNVEYHQQFAHARRHLQTLASRAEKPGLYYDLAFSVATAQGWERSKVAALRQEFYRDAPDHLQAHFRIAQYLLPQWHGQPGESARYAAVAASRLSGPEGDVLYGRLAAELAEYRSDEKFLAESGFDYNRVRQGLLAWTRQHPGDCQVARRGLQFAREQGDLETANRFQEQLAGGSAFAAR